MFFGSVRYITPTKSFILTPYILNGFRNGATVNYHSLPKRVKQPWEHGRGGRTGIASLACDTAPTWRSSPASGSPYPGTSHTQGSRRLAQPMNSAVYGARRQHRGSPVMVAEKLQDCELLWSRLPRFSERIVETLSLCGEGRHGEATRN